MVDSSERAKAKIDFEAKRRGDMERYFKSLCVDYSGSCEGDVPIVAGMETLKALRDGMNIKRCIAVTMRGEEGREPTTRWLYEHLTVPFRPFDLYMSPGRWANEKGEFYNPQERKLTAVDFKRETALRLMSDFEIVIALDDHPDICLMYQSIGIPALMTLYPGVDCLSPVGDRKLQ